MLYASPNALSCFHRLGVLGSLVGRSLAEVTTDLLEDSSPADESLPLVVMGRAPWRTDVEARGVCLSLRAVPLTERRPAARRRAALPRRLRAAPPRARADHQGRDDPRDPPPGEEQPADRRGAAATAGPADAVDRGQRGARGGDAPGHDDRAGARDALPDARRGGGLRHAGRPQPAPRGGRGLGRGLGAHGARRDVRDGPGRGRHRAGPRAHRAGHERGGARVRRAGPGPSRSSPSARVATCGPSSPTTASGCPTRRPFTGLGTQIVATLVRNELRGTIAWADARGRRTQVVLELDLREPRRPEPRRGRRRPRDRGSRGRGAGQLGAAGAGGPALECATLVLGQAAPDAGVLAGLERPLQAGVDHGAATAHGLRVLDLLQGRAGVPDREEQLGVLVRQAARWRQSIVSLLRALRGGAQRGPHGGGSQNVLRLVQASHLSARCTRGNAGVSIRSRMRRCSHGVRRRDGPRHRRDIGSAGDLPSAGSPGPGAGESWSRPWRCFAAAVWMVGQVVAGRSRAAGVADRPGRLVALGAARGSSSCWPAVPWCDRGSGAARGWGRDLAAGPGGQRGHGARSPRDVWSPPGWGRPSRPC